jgi:NAD(P)H-hydrate epimerase
MSDIPAVTASQMAEVDRIMAATFGVEPVQLMEHAGYGVATFTRMLFQDFDVLDQSVLVLAGSGGNGGDALVAARLLAGWGARVTVVLSRPDTDLQGLPAAHLRAVRALGVDVLDGTTVDALPEAAVLIDGLLGAGAVNAPTGTVARLVDLANGHDSYLLAIDVPSGMNATTGEAHDPCIVASGTLTLGLPKTGLVTDEAIELTGSLVLIDIGIPPAAYREIGVTVPDDLFSATWMVPLRGLDDEGTGALHGL